MRRFILIILSSILFIGLLACSGCKKTNNSTMKEQNVREVVWKQLTSEAKEGTKENWKNSSIYKVTLKDYMRNISI